MGLRQEASEMGQKKDGSFSTGKILGVLNSVMASKTTALCEGPELFAALVFKRRQPVIHLS